MLGYAVDSVAEGGEDGGRVSIEEDHYLTVHIDEKWFFAQHDGGKVCLTPNKLAPDNTIQHKNHIKKVMFLVAVTRLQQIKGRRETWWERNLPFLLLQRLT